MVYYLEDNEIWFPDPHEGEPDGLIAVGGDLSMPRLILAYSNGIFPWFSFRNDPILWWCPLDRFVIFPDEIHVSHTMRQLIKRETYKVTFCEDFEGVIHNCSINQDRVENEGAWLGGPMIEAYKALYNAGYAASAEVWEEKEGEPWKLVGGLYGVVMHGCFFGESMFSLVPSASKLALISLARRMKELRWKMIDCQFETDHLLTMGGRHISYEEYMKILKTPLE